MTQTLSLAVGGCNAHACESYCPTLCICFFNLSWWCIHLYL